MKFKNSHPERQGRNRGCLTRLVMSGDRNTPFTVSSFCPPLTRKQARDRIGQLFRAGKLVKVHPDGIYIKP